jgi:hypothetical protein
MIRRIALPVFGLACFSSLLLACFRTVLFEDGQFAHFDAAFFYYPLYQRVQQEWAAGRRPRWDPGQNGGTPLLAIPMAAVLKGQRDRDAGDPWSVRNDRQLRRNRAA